MLSGDFIVGFPTETDEDFEATVRLVERVRYKNSFIFKYSARPGTIAHEKLVDDVPEAVKRARNGRLLGVQNAISERLHAAMVGSEVGVFVEGLSARERKLRKRASSDRGGPGLVSLTIGGQSMEEDRGCSTGCAATDVLSEEKGDESGSIQLAGRTDGDVIVFFDAPDVRAMEVVGTTVRVRVTGHQMLALAGELLRG
jgi:tRNA-2-methylthio-N6-dimethylallyladenosine synthase